MYNLRFSMPRWSTSMSELIYLFFPDSLTEVTRVRILTQMAQSTRYDV